MRRSEQQKPASNGSETTLTPKLLINLWERMTHIYGHRWISAYGESAVYDGELSDTAKTWGSGLHGVNGDQLAQGLHACIERADPWPPSLPEFAAMCKGRGKNDLGLDYVPEYHRSRETRPGRMLESDPDKAKRKEAAAEGVRSLREVLKTGGAS